MASELVGKIIATFHIEKVNLLNSNYKNLESYNDAIIEVIKVYMFDYIFVH